MKVKFISFCVIMTGVILSCNNKNGKYDASGTFEAEEVVVSTLATGKILSLNVEEGSILAKDSIVGHIDPSNLTLQKEEVQATIESLGQQTSSAEPQVRMLEDQLSVQQSQLASLTHERTRIENLLKQDAATGKQLDDINAQVDVVRREMQVTQQQINVQRNITCIF